MQQALVSTKNQVVIPKAIRKKLGIRPGQTITFNTDKRGRVYIEPPMTMQDYIDKYAGTLKNTAWQKEGIDAAAWLRRDRDEEWD